MINAEEKGFGWIMMGQAIASIGCAFIISGPSKVSTIWFGDNERAIATTIGALSVPIGSILGFVLPMFFIREYQDNEWTDPATKIEAIKEIGNYIIGQSIVVCLFCIPIIIFVKNRPEHMPSILSYKDTKVDANLMKNIKELLTNKNFLILFLSYSILYANYSCLGAVVGPLTDAFNFNPSNASFFGVAFIVLGITGSFVHAIMLDKYKKFKK